MPTTLTSGIGPENTIVVYRQGDTDSETIADNYCDLYGLDSSTFVSANAPTGQKVPIACGPAEILNSEAEFNTQVLNPILAAITDLETYGFNVWCVVLGHNVPGGFTDGDDVISSTSRIARIHHSFSKKTRNDLYNRTQFRLYNADDKDFCLVVARIDSGTLTGSQAIINRSAIIKKQVFVNGTFYIDPYSNLDDVGVAEYQQDIVDFQNTLLPFLNLDSWSTGNDPYSDAIIPVVQDDSFIWSWYTDRGSLSFFKSSNAFRYFAYNGDFDGAYVIRTITDRRWPALYLASGYAATAGAMSDPTVEGLLRPYPFFNALLRGATLGEAYTYALPFVDWTITLVGDPLMKVSFPNNEIIPETEPLTEDESWRLMFRDLAKAITFYARKKEAYAQVLDTVVASTDISTEVDLLQLAKTLSDTATDIRQQNTFIRVTEALLSHIRKRIRYRDLADPRPSVSSYLLEKDEKVSMRIYESQTNNDALVEGNIATAGSWEFEFVLQPDAGAFAFYHFELDILDLEENIIFQINSQNSLDGWSWEKEKNKFIPLESGGVPSSYVGRRIRYTASNDETLISGMKFIVRVRQKDQVATYQNRDFTEIIYT